MKFFKFKRSHADPLFTASKPFLEKVELKEKEIKDDASNEPEALDNNK